MYIISNTITHHTDHNKNNSIVRVYEAPTDMQHMIVYLRKTL